MANLTKLEPGSALGMNISQRITGQEIKKRKKLQATSCKLDKGPGII